MKSRGNLVNNLKALKRVPPVAMAIWGERFALKFTMSYQFGIDTDIPVLTGALRSSASVFVGGELVGLTPKNLTGKRVPGRAEWFPPAETLGNIPSNMTLTAISNTPYSSAPGFTINHGTDYFWIPFISTAMLLLPAFKHDFMSALRREIEHD